MNEVQKSKIIQTAFRILLSLIFLVAGFQHLIHPNHIALRLAKSPWAEFLSIFMPLNIHAFMAGLALVIGGLGLFFGSKTKTSALLLIAVLIPITITVQMDGPETLGPLFKNIAILGGLIYFSYFGIGQGFGIDAFSIKERPLSHYFSVAKIVLVALFALTLSPSLFTSEVAEAKNIKSVSKDVAILVREERHLQVAIKTLIQGKDKDGSLKIKEGTIVVCGKPGVMALKKDSKIKDEVQKGISAGIRIVACGLSLKEAALSSKDLLKEVEIVENGLWEMIRLQSLGYASVEL